jgi:circadian clock protein KaiC
VSVKKNYFSHQITAIAVLNISFIKHIASDPLMVLQRISTGIPGLDSLIEGGIPRGFTVLVAGNPGTGKTILTSHFLHDGLKAGESTVYVSFSESKEQFYANVERIGMDFNEFEKQSKFVFLDFALINKEGMRDALDEVLATIKEIKATRLVVDSFSAISQAYETLIDARIVLQTILGKIMRAEGVTSLLISEIPAGQDTIGSGIEEFVADGIIRLEHGPNNAIPITLRIVKMRSTAINREPHVCTIGRYGMTVYSKQNLKLTYSASEERIPSGVSGLDERIGQGLLRGSTTCVMGAAGVGKTTLAFQFVAEGVENDEHGIFCSLEESADEVRRMAQNYGYDIAQLEKKGLVIMAKNVEDQSPDAFIADLASEIDRVGPKRLAIDGLSAFEHMHRNDMFLITKRLASLLRQNEITSIFTLLTSQESGFRMSELGISSLFQNILALRYVEVEGRMKRTLIIPKMRSTHHDESIMEFSILPAQGKKVNGNKTITGIRIEGAFENYVGILTGVAQKTNNAFAARKKRIAKQLTTDQDKRLTKFANNERRIAEEEKRARPQRKTDSEKRLISKRKKQPHRKRRASK